MANRGYAHFCSTLTGMTDPTGQTVNYTYDASKRVTAVQTVDTKGTADTSDDVLYKNVYTYENDRIKTVSHNTTSDTPDVTYTFGYDELGRKTTVKVGTQTLSTTVYENDRSGLLSEVQYGNGGKVKYSYDDFDRMTGVKYDDVTTDRYTYEYGANGETAEVTDNELGRTIRTDYDLADRPCQTEQVDNATGEVLYKTGLKYDKLNNLTTFSEHVDGETHKSEYTYDRDNRVTQIAFNGGTHKVGYTYDELGRVTTRVAECGADAGKVTSTYGYVAGGYGANSTTPLVASISQNGISFAYTYDSRGNIASETRTDASGNSLTTTYVYDALGQLVRVNDPHDTTASAFGTTWVFSYDRGGNITGKACHPFSTGALEAALETIPYAYGDSNWKDKLTSYDNRSFSYDAIGNPTSDGIWSYEWEVGRRLKSMNADGGALYFKYDHNGLRTQKVVQLDWYPTTYNYLLHGKLITHMTVDYTDWDEVAQKDVLHFFYDVQSRPAKVSFNGVIYTYIHNLQGDIIGLLDSAGNLIVEYKYDAWGKLLSTTGTMANTLGKRNPFRYRSYVYDEESGLYYLRSRYYNPEWSRFVNADACMGWSSLIGKNLYMYCSNGPIVFSDSNGFSPEVTPSPSRPENWDTAFYARMLRQKIKATITRVAKTIVNKVKSVYNTVKKAVKNAVLVAKASQLAQHGGGVIKFNTGLKATCYTSEYWYRTNRPASSWGSFAFDAGLTASGAAAGKISALSKISPYLEGIGIGMLAIDACINLQVDQINRCIDSSGSIGWISWERSVNAAPMPTAWDSTTFTPGEWFGEIESVEFFE